MSRPREPQWGYPDQLALRIFRAGWNLDRIPTMLTGLQPNHPDYDRHLQHIEDVLRRDLRRVMGALPKREEA